MNTKYCIFIPYAKTDVLNYELHFFNCEANYLKSINTTRVTTPVAAVSCDFVNDFCRRLNKISKSLNKKFRLKSGSDWARFQIMDFCAGLLSKRSKLGNLYGFVKFKS
uniref:Uncharacterized protein n=1 Tax=Rhizophagus irregularis (strain DAOM 181602 / DAOM 197198 / MUCL 43194) TaxID=747089 RepID=U9USS0_RHIID